MMKNCSGFSRTLLTVLLTVMSLNVSGQEIDAAVFAKDRAYFFQGNQYFRYTIGDYQNSENRLNKGYPKDLPGGWKGLTGNFLEKIDAALYYPPNGKTYLFSGNQYVCLSGVQVDPGYPRKLPGGWRGLPKNFQDGIDAAVHRSDHTYFFKGNSYVRFSGTKIDKNYPKLLPGGWKITDGFSTQLSAAMNRNNSDELHFFSGKQYAVLDDIAMLSGYPVRTSSVWAKLNTPTDDTVVITGDSIEAIPWTTQDILDSRIDEFAQYALMRMFNGQANEKIIASSILGKVKSNELAGVYVVDQVQAAKRAIEVGMTWWTILPEGNSAVCIVNPESKIPMIVFSKEVRSKPNSLDENLVSAWQQCGLALTSFPGYIRNIPPKQPRNKACHDEPGLGGVLIRATRDNAPVDDFSFEIFRGTEKFAGGNSNFSSFTIEGLEPSIYSLYVHTDDGRAGYANVEVAGRCIPSVSISLLHVGGKTAQSGCDIKKKLMASANCGAKYGKDVTSCGKTFWEDASGACKPLCMINANKSQVHCLAESFKQNELCVSEARKIAGCD